MGILDRLRGWLGLTRGAAGTGDAAGGGDAAKGRTGAPDAAAGRDAAAGDGHPGMGASAAARPGSAAPRPAPRPAGAPDEPAAAVALDQARQAFASGAFAQASDVAAEGLRQLPEDDPPPPAIHALASSLLAVRGGAAVNLGRIEEAVTHFEQSMDRARASGLAETIAAARLNLVDARTRSGSFPIPDPVLAEAVEGAAGTRYEDPAGKLLIERGVALAGKGHLQDAIGALDRAIALRPAWPFPLYQRAWVRFLQGDSGGALDDYREVARNHPVFFTVQREIRGLEDVAAGKIPIEAFRSYCIVRGEIAKNAKAVESAARRIVERFPTFAPGWVLLAEACLASGQGVDEAREASREALRHDPDPDTAVAALFAEWHFATRAHDADAANETAERLRTAYPEYPAVEVIRRLGANPDPRVMVQWTWAMDGTLHVREFRREEGQTPPQGS